MEALPLGLWTIIMVAEMTLIAYLLGTGQVMEVITDGLLALQNFVVFKMQQRVMHCNTFTFGLSKKVVKLKIG